MLSNTRMTKLSKKSERIYGGESLADRQAKRRVKFLQAGHELFGTIGFRQTTVRILCKQAELTDRYFYESFSSIEQLLEAVYLQAIENIKTQVMLAIVGSPQSSSEILIERALDAFFKAVECPKTARIIWLEVLGISQHIDVVYNNAIQGFAQLFRQLSLTMYPNIALDEDEISIIAVGMIGAVSEATKMWLISGYQFERATMVRSSALIFRGLILTLQQQAVSNSQA